MAYSLGVLSTQPDKSPMYKEATPIVRDVNEDGRRDFSLVGRNGKVLQTYLQPESGFGKTFVELEKKVNN
ncbi:MAG: hypothetical protein AABX29_07670 [Nanoarchaeota archaeon]